ncbi:MAG: hypothetical protein RLZZ216_1468 [Cyanobacteriota bacterium]
MASREAAVMDLVDPTLTQVMGNVRRLIELYLPDDGVLREQAWRSLRPLIAEELSPLNDRLAQALFAEISDMAPDVVEEATKMVRAVKVQPAIPTVGLPIIPTAEAILRTEVAGRRLEGLFRREGRQGLSAFIRGNLQTINYRVQEGILRGTVTRDIADEIAVIMVRNGQEYLSTLGASAGRTIRSDSMAIARTAIQDANRQIKEAVYSENAEVLSDLKWEWVSVLDSRTCPTCAPLDGKRWANRKDAPRWPVHPNCRCQVVPVDPDEAADVRAGQEVSPEPMKGERAYKTKVKVNGEKLYRKAVDVNPGKDGKAPSYADFLAQSNQKTQQMFFGGGNAGSIRAETFRRKVKAGSSPEKALRDLINVDKGVGRFKPAAAL